MPLCILCRNERDLTEEHIIPDCIGGSLKPKLLCKDCNSTIGSTIDGPFSAEFLVQLPRQAYQIPGKSGAVPNPFRIYGSASHEGRDLKIRVDEQFKPYTKTMITEAETDRGLEINIIVDKTDEGNIESILRTKITRHYKGLGRSEADIQEIVMQAIEHAKKAAVEVSHQPSIKFPVSMNSNALILESIKIAYEMAAVEFGHEYITSSPVAEKLRNALQNRTISGVFGNGLIDTTSLKNILPGPDVHYVLLLNNYCLVSIFGVASIVVYCEITETFVRTKSNSVLYIFDPINRSHKKFSLPEYVKNNLP